MTALRANRGQGTVEFHEYPLLSYQDLMLAILKVAARGRTTIEDCLAELRRWLAAAHEDPPVGAEEMRRRLQAARTYLTQALLLAPADDEAFRITDRGRRALAEHPMGIDDSVLMEYPEFRAFITRLGEQPEHADPHQKEFDEGYEAHGEGRLPADNPYDFDRIEHLAWENGWFTARDDATDSRQD